MALSEKTGKMCRACLSTNERYSELISLFSGGCALSEVPKKMMNVSNVLVHKEDGLPGMICRKCVFLVKVADCFKKQLQIADEELRKIWDQAKDTEESTSNMKTAVDSSDTELEDLAYNPKYISDEVKAEMEEVFRKKHEMLRNREVEEMSKFLKNLDKIRFSPSHTIKKEIFKTESSDDSIENGTSEFNESDSFQNGNISDNKSDVSIENGMVESAMAAGGIKTETIDSVETENPVEDSEEQTLKAAGSAAAADNTGTLKTEKSADFEENEATKTAQPEAERNIDEENVDPNVIIISDTSDDEGSKSGKKTSTATPKTLLKGKEDTLATYLRGEKRKAPSVNAPLLKKAIVTGMPRIQVKKVFQSVQVVNTQKTQSKIVPRTYFLCTTCNVRLQSVAAVLLHHNEVHSPNKNSLQCRMCNKAFPTKSQLLAHFDQHVETHLFRCSYCPNEFVLKDNLTRHMLNHTKEKPLEPKNKRMRTSNENFTGGRKPETRENGFTKTDEDAGQANKFTRNS